MAGDIGDPPSPYKRRAASVGVMLRIDNTRARRIFLDRHLLLRPETGPGRGADLSDLIARLGFVQVDSVNTFARAHDLILWSRRGQYRPRALDRLQNPGRAIFEHWTHDAAVLPVAHFPHWRHRFETDRQRLSSRWQSWHDNGFLDHLARVRDHIGTQGACATRDLTEGEARGSTGWWDWSPSKTALEYLWRTGELSICHRDSFRKVYDLTERVIPPEHLNARTSRETSVAWACDEALDRLGFATSGELSAFYELATKGETKAWADAAKARGEIVDVEVECTDGTWRKSLARPNIAGGSLPEPSTRVRILSPFDPMLRDRKRAARLFGFDYRIEIFTPAAKRRYGYYVFPVWEGDRAIGRIDMKTDRDADTLRVVGFWSEPGVPLGKGRTARLEAELARAARFAGLAKISFADDWLKSGDGLP